MTEEQKEYMEELVMIANRKKDLGTTMVITPAQILAVDAELTRLRGEMERLTKAMDTAMCVYCRTVTPKDPDEIAKHILGCKKHPINLIIELEQSIIAERKAIAEAVRRLGKCTIAIEYGDEFLALADRIEGGQI
jgi:hypothetical protein